MTTFTASDIMTTPCVTVLEDTSLEETAREMIARDVGSVLVVDQDGMVTGIMTETDFGAERVPLPFSTSAALRVLGRWFSEGGLQQIYQAEASSPVREFMTTPVHTVEEEATVREVVSLMIDRNVDHVPVLRGGKPVGMVTRRNLLQLLFLKIDPRTGQKTS